MESSNFIFYITLIFEILLIISIVSFSIIKKENLLTPIKKNYKNEKKNLYLLNLFLILASILLSIFPIIDNRYLLLTSYFEFYCCINLLLLIFILIFKYKKVWTIIYYNSSYLYTTLYSMTSLIITLSSNWYKPQITLIHSIVGLILIIINGVVLNKEKNKLKDQEWLILTAIYITQLIYNSIILFTCLRILFF